jgi:RimJ/RimL family protein N-acetyltransferase
MTVDWSRSAVAANFVISTTRLEIRPLAEQDLQLYLDLYTNAATMAYIGDVLCPDKARSSFQAALLLNANTPFKRLFLTVVQQEQAVGLCAINQWDSKTAQVELGIMLLKPWQGRGYAAEAFSALIQRVQQQFAQAAILVDVNPQNQASLKLMLKVGFLPDPQHARTFWIKPLPSFAPF